MFSLLAAAEFAATDRRAISAVRSVAITNASQIGGLRGMWLSGHALWPRGDKAADVLRRFLNGLSSGPGEIAPDRGRHMGRRGARGLATLSPLDGSGIDLHKPPLLLDRLCTSLEFVVQTRFAGTT